MNLYEHEGKKLFAKYGIPTPKGVVVRRGDDARIRCQELGIDDVVVKAQVLSGKRGKNNGIRFCSSVDEVDSAVQELFNTNIRGQYVAAVLIEEKLDIAQEHYFSITYDTTAKRPMFVYSSSGGMKIEEVGDEKILKKYLDIRGKGQAIPPLCSSEVAPVGMTKADGDIDDELVGSLFNLFLNEDCRLVEINPLVKTKEGRFIAADAKIALDDDAFYRHEEWKNFEERTMMGRLPTEREVAVRKIDEGEAYYRGTAGKYIEMDGDIAVLFSGGGASIANMDALIQSGLKPANYTEYSGNPPREKVYRLSKIVLSKPGLKGLWIVGGVANFTDISATFQGIIEALVEIKPTYPIVVRRAGPNEKDGMRLMGECAKRNGLNIKLFGKEVSMGETATMLAEFVYVNSTK